MSYRNFYQHETGLLLPKTFEVHHIDLDSDNHPIENLVALPRSVHRIYHARLDKIKELKPSLYPSGSSSDHYNIYIEDEYKRFFKIYYDVGNWIDYRDHLLDKLPNVHNLSYQ